MVHIFFSTCCSNHSYQNLPPSTRIWWLYRDSGSVRHWYDNPNMELSIFLPSPFWLLVLPGRLGRKILYFYIVVFVKLNQTFITKVCFHVRLERKQWQGLLSGQEHLRSLIVFEITSIKMFTYRLAEGSTRRSNQSFPLVVVSVTAIIWHQFQNGAKVFGL